MLEQIATTRGLLDRAGFDGVPIDAAIAQLATRVELDDIIGPAEIREMAGGVSGKTLHVWRHRDGFPQPIKTLSIGDLYDRRQIRSWLAEHRMRKIDA